MLQRAYKSLRVSLRLPSLSHALQILGASLVASLLSGCLTVRTIPTPTVTPRPPTATATIEFPTLIPTATNTPEPTPTPTPDILSGLAEVLYSDSFGIQRDWRIPSTAVGGVGWIDGRLSISVRRPNTTYAITRDEPIVNDFFMEAKARAELCSQDDEYGILFRADSEGGFYRFTLTCDGEARVTRTFNGTEAVLIPKTLTNTVIPGLLVDNRLGVLAEQEVLRFFINGEEVFSLRDRTSYAGRIGMVVRSRQGGQTTASFDELIVRALVPTATPTVSPTPAR